MPAEVDRAMAGQILLAEVVDRLTRIGQSLVIRKARRVKPAQPKELNYKRARVAAVEVGSMMRNPVDALNETEKPVGKAEMRLQNLAAVGRRCVGCKPSLVGKSLVIVAARILMF
jgi:hypothetical protein